MGPAVCFKYQSFNECLSLSHYSSDYFIQFLQSPCKQVSRYIYQNYFAIIYNNIIQSCMYKVSFTHLFCHLQNDAAKWHVIYATIWVIQMIDRFHTHIKFLKRFYTCTHTHTHPIRCLVMSTFHSPNHHHRGKQETTILISIPPIPRLVLPSLQINVIYFLQNVPFCVWLLSFKIKLRAINIVVCVSSLFLKID